jgi:hypothetical protein
MFDVPATDARYACARMCQNPQITPSHGTAPYASGLIQTPIDSASILK